MVWFLYLRLKRINLSSGQMRIEIIFVEKPVKVSRKDLYLTEKFICVQGWYFSVSSTSARSKDNLWRRSSPFLKHNCFKIVSQWEREFPVWCKAKAFGPKYYQNSRFGCVSMIQENIVKNFVSLKANVPVSWSKQILLLYFSNDFRRYLPSYSWTPVNRLL